MDSHYCTVSHFYWVAKYSYNQTLLEGDAQIPKPFILRSNVENDGYLSFLLPLLYDSTYSLVVDSQDLPQLLPSTEWVDSAIHAVSRNASILPVCGVHPDTLVARGCMLLKTSDLRFIWTKTSFRRQSARAMEVFSHVLRCKFHFTLVSDIVPSPRLRQPSYVPPPFDSYQCESVYDVRDFACNAHYPSDKSIGVVLPQFKRTWLERQLESAMNGTQRPSQIIVLQGMQHQNYQPLLQAWPIAKHVWMTNWDSPFFFRFLVPLLLTTHYIHNIDDDVVFSARTLERLNAMIDAQSAPVGIKGRVVSLSDYRTGRFGQSLDAWKDQMVARDFLCNSYGGVLESVKVFWRYRPYTQRNGEDIHYSFSNSVECGGHVGILPVENETEDVEDHGWDAVATYRKGGHFAIRGKIIRSWALRGFQFVNSSRVSLFYPVPYKQFSRAHREEALYVCECLFFTVLYVVVLFHCSPLFFRVIHILLLSFRLPITLLCTSK